jgi:single-stranded-DNA-specific exonuclease
LSIEIKKIESNLSLLNRRWELKQFEERNAIYLSQKFEVEYIIAKLLTIRGVSDDSVLAFLKPDINRDLPNPNKIKDIDIASKRVIQAIEKKQKIGIIADYDVDGSTSASILYKFLKNFTPSITLKIPNRLVDGYGPNIKLMKEMINDKIDLLFTLDCGTTSNNIIDNQDFKKIDVIVIDHHLSDSNLPNVCAIINPNRNDDISDHKDLAAVGVTFLFLMYLRKKMRNLDLFIEKKEPNLLSYLDLVALGTVCDVVELKKYNRLFVKKGLDLTHKRYHKGIAKLIDNSKISSSPTSQDLGYIVGPQINAASRIDDSSLASKLLITNDLEQIETISRKLFLLNEKRKLIESQILENAKNQAYIQRNSKYILVYGNDWHQGVLGIIASKISEIYYKPVIVISFLNKIGTGSARSIENVDLGKIIIKAKRENIIISGGGHAMAAGLKINFSDLDKFKAYLNKAFSFFSENIFKRIDKFDSIISVNDLNFKLIESIEKLQPFGKGNPEPIFIIKDIIISSIKVIKNKHILIFFENNLGNRIKGICFNSKDTILGDYLEKFNQYKFYFSCIVAEDKFTNNPVPQLIIKDIMKID